MQCFKSFDKALDSGKEVSRVTTEYGTTISKQVEVQNGDTKGLINVSFYYKANDLKSVPEISTAVPKITEEVK